MIKANELRIDNWVQAPTIGFCQINGIQTHSDGNIYAWVVSRGMEFQHRVNVVDLLPIILNEKILISSGFQIRDLPQHYCNGRPGYQILIQKSANRWLMLTGRLTMIGHINENNNPFEGVSIGMYQSIHEVQNIYFGLTGEELKIEL